MERMGPRHLDQYARRPAGTGRVAPRVLRVVLAAALVGGIGAGTAGVVGGDLGFGRVSGAFASGPKRLPHPASELVLSQTDMRNPEAKVEPIPGDRARMGGREAPPATPEGGTDCADPVRTWLASADFDTAGVTITVADAYSFRVIVGKAVAGDGPDITAAEAYIRDCREFRRTADRGGGESSREDVRVEGIAAPASSAATSIAYSEVVSEVGENAASPVSRRYYYGVKNGVGVLVYIGFVSERLTEKPDLLHLQLDTIFAGQLEKVPAG